jgi:hypothetical protein
MRQTGAALLLAAVVALQVACSRTEEGGASSNGRPDSTAWSPSFTTVSSPAGDDSSQPSLTASAAGVILSWVELAEDSTATLKFSERTASGWSPATPVASGDDWFLTWADVPMVLRLSDGTIAANWLRTTDADVEAYDIWLSYSRDNGKTWARPFTPHHDGTKTQHGFASLFEMPGKGLGLVWLDGRAIELDKTSPDGGDMSLRFASFDTSWKQTADEVVNARVCECCHTSAVATADGVVTAYRGRTKEEVRDTQVSRLENGKWTPAATVFNDNWNIAACPVNGPALSARDRAVAVAWFTVKNDQGQAYAAFSNDAGHTWGAPIRLDDAGSTGRVDIELLEDGSAVATWLEFVEQRTELRTRRVFPSGLKSAPSLVAMTDEFQSGHPRLARYGDELIYAWTARGAGAVQKVQLATTKAN